MTVTATSPNLQGDRVTITGANGDYKLPLLPAGPYTVKYELEGMAARDVETKISAAQTTQIDVGMAVAAIAEEILVTAAEAATISETSTAQSTYTAEEIGQARDRPRRPEHRRAGRREPVPPAPNAATHRISGAMSFENLWLVNGVVINENLRGQPLDLVHRGRDRGDHGLHRGHLRRVWPLHRRRRQRADQVRRQRVPRLAALQHHQPGLESDDNQKQFNPDFESEDKINETYEATLGGAHLDGPHLVLPRRRAIVETETHEPTAQTGIAFPQARRAGALRGQAHLRSHQEPHPDRLVPRDR